MKLVPENWIDWINSILFSSFLLSNRYLISHYFPLLVNYYPWEEEEIEKSRGDKLGSEWKQVCPVCVDDTKLFLI